MIWWKFWWNSKDTKKKAEIFSLLLVRMTGLEPAHLAALEPKSNVSANSTTSAYLINSLQNLNLARLPIPPRAQSTFYCNMNYTICEYRQKTPGMIPGIV